MRAAWTKAGRSIAAVGLTLLPGGCGVLDRGFLSPAGPVADAMRGEFWFVCVVLLFVVGPVFLLVPLIGWHYRLRNTKHAYRPQWGFNWPLEGLIWIPPIGIVVFLSFHLWHDTHRLDPYKPLPGEALNVQVIAADWKWLFIYPKQGIATVNRLVIPVGQPIHLYMTSATVMQSLLIPQLAGQIYAMAGMQTQLNLRADRAGTFLGENTQFNGMHFEDEKFDVDAMAPADFKRWVAETHAQPNRLDVAKYQTLTRRDVVKPMAFGAVDPDLFQHVVAQQVPSGHALQLAKLPSLPLPMGVPLPTGDSAK